jgi:hypothetical protein
MSETPKPAEYLYEARDIAVVRSSSTKPIALAVLSSFTTEILRPYLVVEGKAEGLRPAAIRCFARWRAFLPRRAPNRGEYFLGPRHAFKAVIEGTSYFCAL